MANIILRIIFCIIIALSIISCQSNLLPYQEDQLEGRVLIWHTWQDQELVALEELFEKFSVIYPEVTIVHESFSQDHLTELFESQVAAGLGPDIVIGPASLIPQFADQNLLHELVEEEFDPSFYSPAMREFLNYQDKLYGLPFTLQTHVLYYNKDLLDDTPPIETIQDLEEQSQAGHRVAIPINFRGAFWGIQAFGGRLFGETGRVVLNQGGFANWLIWLQKAQSIPAIVLNQNPDELFTLFAQGQVAYYVGPTEQLTTLQNILGKDNLGVTALPRGQNNFAGPLMEAEVMMFNHASANNIRQIALRLARFLTNVEQQRTMALSVHKIPVNPRVQIDPRVSLIVAGLIAQSNTAVPLKLTELSKLNDVEAIGNDLYVKTLEGEFEIGEAANHITDEINKKYNLPPLDIKTFINCMAGQVTIWHSWSGDQAAALKAVADTFMDFCPEVTIRLVNIDKVELLSRYAEAVQQGQGPDLLLGFSDSITTLIANNHIQSIDDFIEPEYLQRFIPAALTTMQLNDRVYGLPLSVELMALYYNPSRVANPPQILDELLTQATPENRFAMPLGFYEAYWGISAFGQSTDSPLFNDEKELVIGEVGLPEWLAWLKKASNDSGMIMNKEKTELKTMFMEEKISYLVADNTILTELQTAMGDDKVDVTMLPSGRPFLLSEGLMFNANLSLEEIELPLTVAQFFGSIPSQTILADMAHKVPVNVNMNVTPYPGISGFAQQAHTAIPIPNLSEMAAIWKWGNAIYDQVLVNDIPAEVATQKFINMVNANNGIVIEEFYYEREACTDEGKIMLWHSWSDEVHISALNEVIDDFNDYCPKIKLATEVLPAEELSRRLLNIFQGGSETTPVITTTEITTTDTITPTESPLETPDFFLAPHHLIPSLQEARALRRIDPFIDKNLRIDYLPQSITALQYQGNLYGLPQALKVPVLYYNTRMVDNPPRTLEQLLTLATPEKSLALNTNFSEAFWAITALGCQPCRQNQLFDELGTPTITADDLASWTDWLQTAQNKPGIILSTDQAYLENLFATGQVAYLIAGPEALNRLEAALGLASVEVTQLPSGPAGNARPFLEVEAFLFNLEKPDEQTILALKFVEFATSYDQQGDLASKANFVPTNNLTIAINDDPTIVQFLRATYDSVLLPSVEQLETLRASRNIYRPIVNDNEPHQTTE